ncbi:MAG: LacI family transcriptional regulator [Spirochaetaceae bacterium]|nr:LacI family transcriptional regulator [Spirochaetaceae bacterium]
MLEQKFHKPRMKDVALAAGVSTTTVSHVLNRTRFVSEETIRKVEAAVEALCFKVNPVARNFRLGKSFFIGFVVSNLENYFYLKIAKGIEKTVKAAGYQLTLIDSGEKKDAEMKNVESLYLRDADGIIIAPTTADCGYLETLLPLGFPLVFVDRRPVNFPADSVLLNNRKAAGDAVSHLIARGRRRIGFVSFHFGGTGRDSTIQERAEGYKEACAAGGLEPMAAVRPWTPLDLENLKRAESYRVALDLLGRGADAFFCGNSLAAIGVYTCLQEQKVAIPGEAGLMTFDDDLWLSMTRPQISAVEQPAELMGGLAAERLLRKIQNPAQAPESLRVEARLILRDSC